MNKLGVCFPNWSAEDGSKFELDGLRFYYTSIVIAVIMFASVVVNAFVIFLFVTHRSLQDFSEYLIINLALSDTIQGLVAGMKFLPILYYDTGRTQRDSPYLCKSNAIAAYIVANCSLHCTFIISLERYYMITKPLTHRRLKTRRTLAVLTLTPWVLAIVAFAMPIIISSAVYEGTEMNYFTGSHGVCYIPFHDRKNTFLIFYEVATILPLVVGFCRLNFKIFRQIRLLKAVGINVRSKRRSQVRTRQATDISTSILSTETSVLFFKRSPIDCLLMKKAAVPSLPVPDVKDSPRWHRTPPQVIVEAASEPEEQEQTIMPEQEQAIEAQEQTNIRKEHKETEGGQQQRRDHTQSPSADSKMPDTLTKSREEDVTVDVDQMSSVSDICEAVTSEQYRSRPTSSKSGLSAHSPAKGDDQAHLCVSTGKGSSRQRRTSARERWRLSVVDVIKEKRETNTTDTGYNYLVLWLTIAVIFARMPYLLVRFMEGVCSKLDCCSRGYTFMALLANPYGVLRQITIFCVYLQSVYNPILYPFFHKKFRRILSSVSGSRAKNTLSVILSGPLPSVSRSMKSITSSKSFSLPRLSVSTFWNLLRNK